MMGKLHLFLFHVSFRSSKNAAKQFILVFHILRTDKLFLFMQQSFLPLYSFLVVITEYNWLLHPYEKQKPNGIHLFEPQTLFPDL